MDEPGAWRATAGKLRRNWFLALASALSVAMLVGILIKELTAPPETMPAADGPFPAGTPAPLEPASPIPSASPPVSSQTARPVASSRPPPAGGVTKSPVSKPRTTTRPAPNASAYTTIQAEQFDAQNGIQVEAAESGSGRHIGFITIGDWVRYDEVGFTGVPANTLLISAANWAAEGRTGQVELRLDKRSNAPAGRMTIPNNGSWFDFTTYAMKIKPTTGVHTVYLTFTSNQSQEFGNVDWIRFQH